MLFCHKTAAFDDSVSVQKVHLFSPRIKKFVLMDFIFRKAHKTNLMILCEQGYQLLSMINRSITSNLVNSITGK